MYKKIILKKILFLPSVHFVLINLVSIYLYITYVNINSQILIISYSKFLLPPVLSILFCLNKIGTHEGEKEKIKIKIPIKLIRILAYLCFSYIFILIIFIDFGKLYRNTEYLLIANAKVMGFENIVISGLYNMRIIIGFISLLFWQYLNIKHPKKYSLIKFILGLCGLIIIIIQLAVNSRSTSLLFIACFAPYLILKFKWNWKIRVLFILYIYLSLISIQLALSGRGKYYQGVSQIYKNTYSTLSSTSVNSTYIIRNVFESLEIYSKGFYSNVHYPDKYMYLSFSPLPSAIDGFDNYRKYQHRVSSYIPFNTFLELEHFDIIYFWLYFLFFFLIQYHFDSNFLKHGTFYLIIVLPAYLFYIGAQQYPIRNFFRYYLIAYFISLIFLKINSIRQKTLNKYK
jgi:hypothetical protein